tara:strand:+ start:366 stop:710 length:345 start_codon:yes stop_codon:yes gene_type:complete
MKTIKNHVQLIGNIGQDPQVTHLENGKVVAQFSMATNENYIDSKGNKQSETHWHSIVAWGKLASLIEKYAVVGKLIAIEGKLAQRSYETTESEKRYYTEIIAREVLFLESKSDK